MSVIEDAAVTAYHKLAGIAQYRSDLYRIFALGFSNPTEDFITDLQSGALVDNLQQCLDTLALNESHYGTALQGLSALTTKHQNGNPQTLLSQLRVEYMRLFIGPSNPVTPIYETLHREVNENGARPMLVASQTALAVEQCYRKSGVKMISHDSPDHLATELEFLVYLCGKEAQAWQEDNNTMAKKWRRLQLEFLNEHLGAWGLTFCRQVRELAAERFYQYFATLAETFLYCETGAFKPRS